MSFKVGDVVKYKKYDSKIMIYHKNFIIDRILFDAQGNIILVKTDVLLIKDIGVGIDNFDRKIIGVDEIELDLNHLRIEKIKKIENGINSTKI